MNRSKSKLLEFDYHREVRSTGSSPCSPVEQNIGKQINVKFKDKGLETWGQNQNQNKNNRNL